jgi:hypothetical protein
MRKSWAYGAGLVVAVQALWFGLIFLQSRLDGAMGAIVVMEFVVLNAAGIGAFATALSAPRSGFALGLSIAPFNALVAVTANLLFPVSGVRVDLSGFHGSFSLFVILLAYGIFVAVVGGGLGRWMRRRNGDAGQAEVTPPAGPSRPIEPFISDPSAPAGPAPPAGHI